MTSNTMTTALTVMSLVEDTFDIPQGRITLSTHVDDVAGWDSLGHSVLLVRIQRRLKIPIAEEHAGFVETVGELVARVEKLQSASLSVGT